MINYILQVLLFQALFLAVYDFFLQKETFFKWNRVYLLTTPLVSFLIPLVKITSFQQNIPQDFIVQLPEVVINPTLIIEQASQNVEQTYNYISLIFVIGAFVGLVLFTWKLKALISLITSNKIILKEGFKLVLVDEKKSAFSFFNYIFINRSLLEKENLKIIQHELIHSKHLHSLDLLYFEFLKIVMWFNPLIYVFQKRITVLHEYISDAEILKTSNKKDYFNQLLAETFQVENISFINQFYKHSFIKKRIIMITKEKSNSLKQFKYLLVVPLLLAMLIYTSCANDTENSIEEIEQILENDIPNEGKYYTGKDGEITFFGSHLNGDRILIEDYTKKEKSLLKFAQEKDYINFEVVINSEGKRVKFLNVDIKSVKESKPIDYTDKEDVPFAVIDEVPVFPGCEDNSDPKKCFQEKVTALVSANFNSGLANDLGLESGVKRIFVLFKIDKHGEISEVQARAPHKALQEEAIRVVKSFPKMIPGKHQGKAVNVKYSLPIAFKVEGDSEVTEVNKKYNNPIYILDGKEISKSDFKKISKDNIKSVNVLNGEKAIAKYGEKGTQGIVEIVLKE